MSFAEELQRIKTAASTIKSVLITKGCYDAAGKRIDEMPIYIASLRTEGDIATAKSTVLLKTITEITEADLGNGTIKAIPAYSAYGCNKVKKVTVPEKVTSVGSYCFYGCSAIETVIFPTTLTSLSTYVFRNCTSLKNINLEDTKITSLGTYTFYGCTSLESIEIPSTVATIATNTFTGCSKLKTIRIHKQKDTISGAPWGATNATVVWDETVPIGYKLFGLPSFQGNMIGPTLLIVPEKYKYGDATSYGQFDNDGMFVVAGNYFPIDDVIDVYSEEDGLVPAISFNGAEGTATYTYIEDIDYDRVIYT